MKNKIRAGLLAAACLLLTTCGGGGGGGGSSAPTLPPNTIGLVTTASTHPDGWQISHAREKTPADGSRFIALLVPATFQMVVLDYQPLVRTGFAEMSVFVQDNRVFKHRYVPHYRSCCPPLDVMTILDGTTNHALAELDLATNTFGADIALGDNSAILAVLGSRLFLSDRDGYKVRDLASSAPAQLLFPHSDPDAAGGFKAENGKLYALHTTFDNDGSQTLDVYLRDPTTGRRTTQLRAGVVLSGAAGSGNFSTDYFVNLSRDVLYVARKHYRSPPEEGPFELWSADLRSPDAPLVLLTTYTPNESIFDHNGAASGSFPGAYDGRLAFWFHASGFSGQPVNIQLYDRGVKSTLFFSTRQAPALHGLLYRE